MFKGDTLYKFTDFTYAKITRTGEFRHGAGIQGDPQK